MNKNTINTRVIIITFAIFLLFILYYFLTMNQQLDLYDFSKDEKDWIKEANNVYTIHINESYLSNHDNLKLISQQLKSDLNLNVVFKYDASLSKDHLQWPMATYSSGSQIIEQPYQGDYIFSQALTFEAFTQESTWIYFECLEPLNDIFYKWMQYQFENGTVDLWIEKSNQRDLMTFYEEQDMILDQDSMTVGLYEIPPYTYFYKGRIYGLVPSLLKDFSRALNLEIQYIIGEREKLLSEYKAGKIDLIFTVNESGQIDIQADPFVIVSSNNSIFSDKTINQYTMTSSIAVDDLIDYEAILNRLEDDTILEYLMTKSFYEYAMSHLYTDPLYLNALTENYVFYGFSTNGQIKELMIEYLSYRNISRIMADSLNEIPNEKSARERLNVLYILIAIVCIGLLIFTIIRIVLSVNERQRLNYLFKHDQLTYLPNTYGFTDLLGNHLTTGIMILIDLRHFKLTNDLYGHDSGDRILVEWANMLNKTKNIVASRTAANQFMIYANTEHPEKILSILFDLFDDYKLHHDYANKLNISGCYLNVSDFKEEMITLKKYLESAMHFAKSNNIVHEWVLFDNTLYQAYLKEEEMVIAIEEALDNQGFTLFYQPQTELYKESTMGAEVLVRWFHKDKGTIYPDQFLPVAEKHGLMRALDFYMIESACRQIKKWQDMHLPYMKISVNMSTYTFESPHMTDDLLKIVRESGIDTHWLALEITEETGLSDLYQAKSTMDLIKASGIRFALDDFGKGYSSLSYVETLPFDFLKIDKAFIDNIHTNDRNLQLYHLIVKLATLYDMKIIAEGVEYKEQLDIIKTYPDTIVQGYYYSKPLSLEDYHLRIEKQNDTT